MVELYSLAAAAAAASRWLLMVSMVDRLPSPANLLLNLHGEDNGWETMGETDEQSRPVTGSRAAHDAWHEGGRQQQRTAADSDTGKVHRTAAACMHSGGFCRNGRSF